MLRKLFLSLYNIKVSAYKAALEGEGNEF